MRMRTITQRFQLSSAALRTALLAALCMTASGCGSSMLTGSSTLSWTMSSATPIGATSVADASSQSDTHGNSETTSTGPGRVGTGTVPKSSVSTKDTIISGTSTLTNDQQYDYRFGYQLAINGPVTTSIAGDTPGHVTLILPVTGSFTETNTTPGGYSAPGALSVGDFMAFWKASNPICSTNVQNVAFTVSGRLDQVRLKTSAGDGPYCFLDLLEVDSGPYPGNSSPWSFAIESPSGLNANPPAGEQWIAVIPTSALTEFENALKPGGADVYAFTTTQSVSGDGVQCNAWASANYSLEILKSKPTATC